MSAGSASLGVMSSAAFKARTKATKAAAGRFASKFKSRGNNMDDIDHALERWERDCGKSAISVLEKAGMANAIVLACDDWLNRKREKGSRLANFRRGTVEEVRIQAKKAVHYLSNKYYAGQGPRSVTKRLDGNYAHERKHYVWLNKGENPIAAGDIDPIDHGKTLDQMCFGEYVQTGAARVEYNNRAQRMQYMTMIEGGLFYDGAEKMSCKISTGFGGVETVLARMYAVDKYGNLFTKAINGFNGTYFNHSSFCAGREIICAGTIVCIEGELKFISTNSGHYKPPPPQLQLYLAALAEEDVDLSDVCCAVLDRNGGRMLRATSLMANARAPEDWPHTDATGGYVVHKGQRLLIDEPK